MTRKDFEALASALRGATPVFSVGTPDDVARARVAQHRASVKAIADTCAADNPRFDRARFMRAAWYEANSDVLPLPVCNPTYQEQRTDGVWAHLEYDPQRGTVLVPDVACSQL